MATVFPLSWSPGGAAQRSTAGLGAQIVCTARCTPVISCGGQLLECTCGGAVWGYAPAAYGALDEISTFTLFQQGPPGAIRGPGFTVQLNGSVPTFSVSSAGLTVVSWSPQWALVWPGGPEPQGGPFFIMPASALPIPVTAA